MKPETNPNPTEDQPSLREITKTSDAQSMFPAVTLVERDLGLQYADRKTAITDEFRAVADKLVETIIGYFNEEAVASGRKQGYNRLGIVSAQLGAYDDAIAAFNEALRLEKWVMI